MDGKDDNASRLSKDVILFEFLVETRASLNLKEEPNI